LHTTGNLGPVMKESAVIAFAFLKANAAKLGLDLEELKKTDFHVHVPEGATPKDGPSAGITLVTAITSVLMDRPVKPYLAMTGEITLRGKVLAVGGIKEKILAAKRAGIKEIIVCHENRKNIEEIEPEYVVGLTFHYVEDIMEVLEIAQVLPPEIGKQQKAAQLAVKEAVSKGTESAKIKTKTKTKAKAKESVKSANKTAVKAMAKTKSDRSKTPRK
jgi:ATP-dependent Lon protease